MTTWINPYISFDGNARTAFETYNEIFGGQLQMLTAGQMGVPGVDPERIMHAQLETADGWTIMGADSDEDASRDVYRCNVTISGVEADLPTARRWFNALAADGGVATMDLAPQMWGATYGQVRDKFGVTWAFNIGGEK